MPPVPAAQGSPGLREALPGERFMQASPCPASLHRQDLLCYLFAQSHSDWLDALNPGPLAPGLMLVGPRLAASLCRAGWNSLGANSKSRGTGARSPSAVPIASSPGQQRALRKFHARPPPPAPAPHQRCISGDLVAFSTCSQSSSGLCLTRMGHVSVRSTAAVWCLPWCSKGHAPDTLLTPPGLPAAPPRRKHPTASTRASRDGQIPHAEGTGDGGQRAHSSAPTHPTKEEATHSHLLRISSQRQSPAAPLLANPQRRDAKPTPGWAP